MKGLYLLFLIFFFFFSNTNLPSQSIFENPITGTNPGASNPYTVGQSVNLNLTVSGIGRGLGLNNQNTNDRYNARDWNTGASIDLSDFFYFTITPNSGYKINFLSFVYTGQASGQGPVNFAFRSSIDGFTTNIGTPISTGTTIDLSNSQFQNITSSVEFRLYGWGGTSTAGTFSVNDFVFNGAILLPIELTNFKIEKKQNKAQLTWNTATETNNDYFVIEHAADGNHFSAIGKVAGAGTTLSAQQYIFTHDSPKSGANYYRLKQVDFDGAFEYSRVVVANFESRATFRVDGNPVATQLNVELQEPAFGAVAEIISAQSALLAIKNIEEEILSQQFDVSDLPAGHYFIRLKSAKFSEIIPFQKL